MASSTKYLPIAPQNYWSFNGNFNDQSGNANLNQGLNYALAKDRFGNSNSALDLNTGYMNFPSGVYFVGDFTLMTWIYWRQAVSSSRIFDFGNGPLKDNVLIGSNLNANQLYVGIVQSNQNFMPSIVYTKPISLNVWYHLSYVQSGSTGTLYLNGTAVVAGILNPPQSVVRNSNFIGKSNNLTDVLTNAVLDEIKIYNVALSNTHILNEFNGRPTTLEKRK